MKLFKSRNQSPDIHDDPREPTLRNAFMDASLGAGMFMEKVSNMLPATVACVECQSVIIDNFMDKTISFAAEDATKDLKIAAKFINDVKNLYVNIEYATPGMDKLHKATVAEIESNLTEANEILGRLKASAGV
jgi:hypothetical protein